MNALSSEGSCQSTAAREEGSSAQKLLRVRQILQPIHDQGAMWRLCENYRGMQVAYTTPDSVQCRVQARCDFSAPREINLSFQAGQIINVTKISSDYWMEGEYTDGDDVIRAGSFPRRYIRKYMPEAHARS